MSLDTILVPREEIFEFNCTTFYDISVPREEIIEFHSTSFYNTSILLFRDFIQQQYVALKQQNPKVPILIRECSGVQPRMWARYGKSINLSFCPGILLNI